MRRNQSGFVLLEVMVVLMIVLILTSSILTSAGIRNRRALKNASEEEAYHAALSAVKLMVDEVAQGVDEPGTPAYRLSSGDGMDRYETSLIFEPDYGDGEISIPVTVWSERTESELVLWAECEADGEKKVVSFIFERKADVRSAETATESSPKQSRWIPVGYRISN